MLFVPAFLIALVCGTAIQVVPFHTLRVLLVGRAPAGATPITAVQNTATNATTSSRRTDQRLTEDETNCQRVAFDKSHSHEREIKVTGMSRASMGRVTVPIAVAP